MEGRAEETRDKKVKVWHLVSEADSASKFCETRNPPKDLNQIGLWPLFLAVQHNPVDVTDMVLDAIFLEESVDEPGGEWTQRKASESFPDKGGCDCWR